jgi:hypothetical protein
VIRYVRVRIRADAASTAAGRRVVYLRVTSDTEQFLSGIEVDRTGEAVHGATFDQRRHVIQKACIATLVEMDVDRTYDTLVAKRRR